MAANFPFEIRAWEVKADTIPCCSFSWSPSALRYPQQQHKGAATNRPRRRAHASSVATTPPLQRSGTEATFRSALCFLQFDKWSTNHRLWQFLIQVLLPFQSFRSRGSSTHRRLGFARFSTMADRVKGLHTTHALPIIFQGVFLIIIAAFKAENFNVIKIN